MPGAWSKEQGEWKRETGERKNEGTRGRRYEGTKTVVSIQ
jgi:hypothetical protein